MSKSYPSIFNDVIGPIMRGPSSSHTAASVRIGKLARQILNEQPAHVLVEFDPEGSLATTYESQGSSIGLAAGLMQWDITNPRLPDALKFAKKERIELEFRITPFENNHPNTYRIRMEGENGNQILIYAISHGGGIVEIVSIDSFSLSIKGDCYETLLFLSDRLAMNTIESEIHPLNSIEQLTAHASEDGNLVQVKMSAPPGPEWLKAMHNKTSVKSVIVLQPVMPVLLSAHSKVPFSNADELLLLGRKEGIDLYKAALMYESQRSSLTETEVLERMREIVAILSESLKEGLRGTAYNDRILGYQSGKFERAASNGTILGDQLMNKVIASNMAMMEVKSSMGLIVAAPTAGSCATLPGTLIPVSDELGLDENDLVKAFLVAGLIGVIIANISTFAAEECGCQAECGSASGMVAGGLVQLMNGSIEQGLAAASMALQNMIGLVCDPVANRVEVPCLGKNIQASLNGIASANMAMAGIDPVIPLDEVIKAMDGAGRSLPRTLRCTGLGGLSVTPTSKRIEKELKDREA